ncbi:hypothetical protein VTJ83DRAFT_4071 [Remersonia thermophila]|uniref:Nitrate/nitrite transporter n=1 Tax=Remersonia thermophila TaxID=72144 RepID=A0ABR4DFV0_9PEZI
MGVRLADLWRTPELNPINKKARSIPVLNPLDRHGRVFFFSWMGFMLAFWAWYTFPPLLSVTIKADLGLTSEEVANSNIISLVATLFVRFLAGPLCDLYGPRRVFGGMILLGAVPVGLAPLVKDVTGLYAVRFFIGILGGTFVPCQVWCTGWFDKNVVGSANGLSGGWGNAGGGITYFIMPAVYDSLVHRWGRSASEAWRITFVVPLICLILCGVALLLLCEDTPTGKWSDRHQHVENLISSCPSRSADKIVTIPGAIADRSPTGTTTPAGGDSDVEKKGIPATSTLVLDEATTAAVRGEMVTAPTLAASLPIIFSWHALFHVATYSCSFGGELAINSILGAYYLKNFPDLGQTQASNFAAIFGFLNFITRPLGGVIGDIVYRASGNNLWWKKGWIHLCGLLTGALLVVIGMLDPHNLGVMVGLVVVMAVFHEAGNGANFALIPHVYPHANGLLSGLTGAGGNLGGVVFSIIFRFMDGGKNYAKGFWVSGIMHIALNLLVLWVPPIPKGQVGGR